MRGSVTFGFKKIFTTIDADYIFSVEYLDDILHGVLIYNISGGVKMYVNSPFHQVATKDQATVYIVNKKN